MRVAGGFKVFDDEYREASEDLFYGGGVRPDERTPRPEPRIAGRERQDLDGRAAGELSSALWPGTEFGKRQGGDMPMLKQATRLPNTAGAGAGGGAGAARAQAGGARGHDSAGGVATSW